MIRGGYVVCYIELCSYPSRIYPLLKVLLAMNLPNEFAFSESPGMQLSKAQVHLHNPDTSHEHTLPTHNSELRRVDRHFQVELNLDILQVLN